MKDDIWAAGLAAPPAASLPEARSQRSPLLDAKVMMVDDEPLMTDLIQAHLEEEGYANFVVCNDPVQALATLRREQPGVLLLDLMMPHVSGFELLESLRADEGLRYTPVIVLTAATGADSKLRALQLGATDFLSKPVDASELVLRVRNTLAFRQYHDRLIHYDQVTGLPNERLFEGSVDALLTQRTQTAGLLALFSITVPQCRDLRESIDRRTADALAVALARRLERVTAPGSEPGAQAHHGVQPPLVARLGEQHFCLVLDGLRDTQTVEAAAKSLLSSLAEPVHLGPHEVVPVPWIGISVAPGDGQTAAALRQSADLAATHGRQTGTAQLSYASRELNDRSFRRLTLGGQLRGAAGRGELRLKYQPKVNINSGRVFGVEALVRWEHPEQGQIAPLDFIPLAEELGLMSSIGGWVIETACRVAAGWASAGMGELKVAVNVSKPQFTAGDLPQVVRQALFDSGLPARQLIIELTESVLMDDVPQGVALMQELKRIGVTLSLDDFGTGYSSLAYLKNFPLDELKIDRSFVVDLPGRRADLALVRTVIDLGHSLGMSVIAEGVENQAQLDCLAAHGCDSYQGFMFSRPLEADKLAELLAATAAKT